MSWALTAVVLVAGVGGVLLEKQKLDAADLRAASASQSEERTRAELAGVAEANRALGARVQELQSELGRLNAKVSAARVEPIKHARTTQKARRKHKAHRRRH